ncbi:MAG: toprim domain-containing protein, partial [Halobacteriaceae archaeon]
GSAKQARDPEYQAVLPLRGKILNVEKHRLDRILENDQIRQIVQAIGAGIGEEFDVSEARYHRIILASDADVDGAHIRTLLLTFFYRHMQPLLEQGYIYATRPPLYRIRYNGETYDAMTEQERDEIIREKCKGSATSVQRFKGLGEMNPEQLWETTMNPENRILKQYTVED